MLPFILLVVTLCVCLSCCSSAAVIRDYNFVRLVHLSNYDEFRAKYLNADNTLKENIFLGVANPDCWALMSSPAFEGAPRYAHNLHAVTLPSETFPFTMNDCAELFFYRSGDPMDGPRDRTTDFRDYELTRWSAEHMRVDSLTFKNRFPYPIKVYWHEEAMEPIDQGTIQPGRQMTISAFLGHIFTANALTDEVPDHEPHAVSQYNGPAFSRIVDYMSVDSGTYEFSAQNRLETCEIQDESQLQTFVEQRVACEDMLLRFLEYSHSAWHVKRLGLNYVQPKLVSSYSEIGFEHRKVPQETYNWLKSWYDREQARIESSESSAGPCMNQHVAPSLITHLTPNEKNRLERELRPILEAWYGEKLFLTSIYGIR
jgi:hypothetical protein